MSKLKAKLEKLINKEIKNTGRLQGGLLYGMRYPDPSTPAEGQMFTLTLSRLGQPHPRGRKIVYPSDTEVETVMKILKELGYPRIEKGNKFIASRTAKSGEMLKYGCIKVWWPNAKLERFHVFLD